MLPQKTRHLLYAVLLVFISIFGSTVLAKTHVARAIVNMVSKTTEADTQEKNLDATSKNASNEERELFATTAMFATIINGANQEVTCPNDGSTVAKFFLCGTSDTRTLTKCFSH